MKKRSFFWPNIAYYFTLTTGILFILLLIRVKVIFTDPNFKRKDLKGKFIISGIHHHWFDTVVFSVAFLNRRIYSLAASDHPSFSRFMMNFIGIVWFDRHYPATGTMKTIIGMLKDGKVVTIYPEGKLEKNGEMIQFQDGLATIASLADSSVLPTYTAPRKHHTDTIYLIVGSPMEPPKDHKRETLDSYTMELQNKTEVLKEYYETKIKKN